MDTKSTILADTMYSNNVLVAKDVSASLPALSLLTSEIQAMGTMEVPSIGLLEAMETTITKVGVDLGYARMMRLEKQNLEFRWVQTSVLSDGSSKPEGCKAFIRGIPKGLPAIALEIGSNIEGEITYATTRYALFANGVEILLVDRLSQILRINGIDYYKNIRRYL